MILVTRYPRVRHSGHVFCSHSPHNEHMDSVWLKVLNFKSNTKQAKRRTVKIAQKGERLKTTPKERGE